MAELHPSRINFTPELPPEILLFHILPRLPAKSILPFLCVCKQWQSFLKTPTFANMHLHHQNHHKLLLLSTTAPYTFRTIDCESPADGLSATHSLQFEAKPENVTILASLNGLVCLGIKKTRYDEEYSDLILWNPLTTEYKTLSRSSADNECYMCTGRAFRLYYSSSDDDYKILRVTYYRDVYIYSLKSDSWRKLDSTQDDLRRIPYWFSESWQPGVLLNEKLYFVKRVKKENSSPPSYSIIRFDLRTEKFSEIAGPSFGDLWTWCLNLMVERGCIHLYVTYSVTNKNSRVPCRAIEMWRMDGDEKDWRKVVTYGPLSSFPWYQQPLHVMKDGNWLVNSIEKCYVYKADLEKHTKEHLCSYDGMDIQILPGGKYIETFVSPTQNIASLF